MYSVDTMVVFTLPLPTDSTSICTSLSTCGHVMYQWRGKLFSKMGMIWLSLGFETYELF